MGEEHASGPSIASAGPPGRHASQRSRHTASGPSDGRSGNRAGSDRFHSQSGNGRSRSSAEQAGRTTAPIGHASTGLAPAGRAAAGNPAAATGREQPAALTALVPETRKAPLAVLALWLRAMLFAKCFVALG